MRKLVSERYRFSFRFTFLLFLLSLLHSTLFVITVFIVPIKRSHPGRDFEENNLFQCCKFTNVYCQTLHTNMYKPPRYYILGSANSPQNFTLNLLKIISLASFFFIIIILPLHSVLSHTSLITHAQFKNNNFSFLFFFNRISQYTYT